MRKTILAALLAASTVALAQSPAPSGDASRGKALFLENGCYACHGTAGHGEPYGPRLAPGPVPWVAFTHQVRQPRSSMPRYAPQFVSDADLADIYAYLGSIPAGPKASAIPLLESGTQSDLGG
ncbi:MAG TPA: cytochrome c [Usitatibacter sp.]|jgi:mono/diheme cytochrome c family protein|nr:cytochrome c [Usitatibacter sp.]